MKQLRMLDLFCGRLGWSKAFLARGWECSGIDLVRPPDVPNGYAFMEGDVLELTATAIRLYQYDFICASPPCEQFSVHGMKHFHPNPPYPELGIKLFNHTREICEASGVPYVMENVRAAQQFVGEAAHHCGPFYLWGTGVPPLLNQGVKKSFCSTSSEYYKAKRFGQAAINEMRKRYPHAYSGSGSKLRAELTAKAATIPPELANCVADYAERILETA
jgi:hypothetical protein